MQRMLYFIVLVKLAFQLNKNSVSWCFNLTREAASYGLFHMKSDSLSGDSIINKFCNQQSLFEDTNLIKKLNAYYKNEDLVDTSSISSAYSS